MQAIFKREFRSYFHTVVGPVFMAALLFFTGIFFTAYNLFQGYPYFSVVLSSITVVLLLLVPLLTMRSFAEEKRMNPAGSLMITKTGLFGPAYDTNDKKSPVRQEKPLQGIFRDKAQAGRGYHAPSRAWSNS